jgi:predicted DCC family thiol-disulfide oxidoreductase YuxK
MTSLTVVYDEACALCRRCKEWMLGERAMVPLSFVAAGSQEAKERFGRVPWVGAELVVVSDEGDVWVGPAAFLLCLWALEDYRELSYTLRDPWLLPFTRRFFRALSSQRGKVAAFLDSRPCGDVVCSLPHHASTPYR